MSTTLVKPAEVERKWYLLDAAGKSLGHVAAEAAFSNSSSPMRRRLPPIPMSDTMELSSATRMPSVSAVRRRQTERGDVPAKSAAS